MNALFTFRLGRQLEQIVVAARLTILTCTLATPAGRAESPAPRQTNPDPSGARVLAAWQADFGDQTVIYRRVAPRILPALPKAQPIPVTPDEAEVLQRKARKNRGFLFLTCTVFDRRVTEMRWEHEGRRYRAFSNIDARYLCGLQEFEDVNNVYLVMLAISEETEASHLAAVSAPTANDAAPSRIQSLPAPEAFSPGRSQYLLAEDSRTAPEAALAAMDTVHRHFDSHKTALIAAHARREAEEQERERQRQEQAQERKTIIIDYWTKEAAVQEGLPTKGAAR